MGLLRAAWGDVPACHVKVQGAILIHVSSQSTGFRNYVPGVPQVILGHMSRLIFADLIVVERKQHRWQCDESFCFREQVIVRVLPLWARQGGRHASPLVWHLYTFAFLCLPRYYGLSVWFPDVIKHLQSDEYALRTKNVPRAKYANFSINFTMENQIHTGMEYYNGRSRNFEIT